MNTVRTAITLIGTLLLAGGYFASQAAYFSNSTASYIRSLDQSSVPILSLVVLLAAAALLIVPAKPEVKP